MGTATATSLQRCGWDTTDLDAARERLETDFGARLRIDEARPPARRLGVDRMGTADFQVATVRLPTQLNFDCVDHDLIIVNTMRAGTFGGLSSSHNFAYRRGDVFLAGFPGANFRCHTDHADVCNVTIPTRYFLDTVGAPLSLRFLSVNPVSASAANRWIETLDHVQQVLRNPDAHTPLVLADTARTLAAQVLETFPTTTTPATAQPGRLLPNLIWQAIDFMESHAEVDISVWDIARAVDLTPAGVTYLFRRHLGVTPMAHLRQIRLHQVHEELVDSDPGLTTVSRVAARWGFTHTADFARLYRSCYAQNPHATLWE